ncbi:hypothetical protein PF005_g18822 [Phytophthora fragariae]|uniref:Uncharacterized protein n=1 Tax=Phytophthora fragariae TaxID=53985 RepID=A0A6A3R8G6_9STRA|nr:hypothetical protein PF003_g32904 [Phytophthora fragariae]KAE8930189.1 hypothetical protein PF009_g19713 [Phytophthora fragariae]KAE8991008.1 hypothetical protein PF011_g18115 [Phytophthora fragariae]KAE9091351.1 hypothetical protein PF010_g18223 [Phytophthora fragariae]KAE9091402.1 hypothetical protein PF007_g18897 [Phytophthora fragariae]
MKIVNPAAFALVCLLTNATGASAKKSFGPKDHGSGSMSEHIKTAADFDGNGAVMKVCPSGDCTSGKFMKLAVASLTELDAEGSTVTSVDKFKPKSSDWTDIVQKDVNGVTVSSTTFVTVLAVGAQKTSVQFNLTADIYQGTTEVTYGTQNLTVPAGALKFTVDIAEWPFADAANTLTLAVTLDAKGPKDKSLDKPKKKSKGSDTGSSDAADIDRVDMGDSMFMDAPTYAIVDGDEVPLVNSSVVDTVGDTEFQWVFPSFTKTLHYDPVLGDATTTSSTTSSGSTTTSSGSTSSPSATTTTSTSSASVLSLSSLVAGGLASIAYSLF